jgi:hypothetical protein
MTTISPEFPRLRAFLAILLTTLALAVATAQAGEVKLQAQVIWGANEGKTPANGKEVEPVLRDKLSKVFKWRNYYEMGRKNFAVPQGGEQSVKMSEDCTVEVRHLGENNFEIKLIGKGKHVVTKRQSIPKGEMVVLAGPDKNDTAWFVVVTMASAK